MAAYAGRGISSARLWPLVRLDRPTDLPTRAACRGRDRVGNRHDGGARSLRKSASRRIPGGSTWDRLDLIVKRGAPCLRPALLPVQVGCPPWPNQIEGAAAEDGAARSGTWSADRGAGSPTAIPATWRATTTIATERRGADVVLWCEGLPASPWPGRACAARARPGRRLGLDFYDRLHRRAAAQRHQTLAVPLSRDLSRRWMIWRLAEMRHRVRVAD